jgi:ketosteroid isomerase-like protein
MDVKSEFAAVELELDQHANGPRLRIEDLKTGRVGYLDALELETLAWLPEGGLHPLLDPSALRFRDDLSIDALAKNAYAALANGDRERLLELLAEDFTAEFAAGMPVVDTSAPIDSAENMIEQAWWALGREYRVRPEASQWIPLSDGRLLVLGRYRGSSRSTGREFEADLMHLWTARDGKLSHLRHLTDTAAWAAALDPE